MVNKKWDEEEIQYLKDNFQNTSCKDIGKRLERSERSVQHKFKSLGLKREPTISQLMRNTPLYNSWANMLAKYREICIQEWYLFENFYSWAKDIYSVDNNCLSRIDTSFRFSPDNCIFKTKAEIIAQNYDVEKIKQTCIEKYGVSHPGLIPTNAEKRKQTCLVKYGFESHNRHPDIQKKTRETNLERYGVENPLQSNIIKNKIKVTCLEKYGTEFASQNQDVINKQIATTISRYGVFPYRKTSGKDEVRLRKWLESFGYDFPSNYSILSGKEIDLYSDELKLGIEYCGIYWHNEDSPEPRDRNYHLNKYRGCLEKDIRLITIFSDEFINRENQVKNFLKSVLGKFDTRLFARKCECIEIDRRAGAEFIEENHILGCKVMSKAYFGLIYENKLVGVTSLRFHHRKSKEIVLDRMCFADGVSIVGGASKMLSRCVDWCKNNGFDKIISWSDNRYSQGNVYEKIGFILDGELRPDYSYVHKNKKERVSKQSMRVPAGISEKEYAKSLGFSRIWDCGKKRYIYQIK